MAGTVDGLTGQQLPLTKDGALKVTLVPMPSGDNAWRTRGDYQREQRRAEVLYWIAVGSFVLTLLAAAGAVVSARSAHEALEMARGERVSAEQAPQ